MVQVHSGLPNLRSKFEEVANDGAIAQLGERLLCTQEVSGSIPLGSIESKDSKDCPLKIEYLYQIPRFKKLNCR